MQHAASRYLRAMPGERRSARRRWLQIGGLVVGLAAFVVLVSSTGWAPIEAALVRTGWWFALIALIDLATVVCDAGAIYSFARVHAKVSYRRVFVAQASGMAINRLTPGNALGEPVKVSMLLEHVPESVAVSSVVMFNLATVWVAIGAIVLGVPLTLLTTDLPPRARTAVWIAAAVLVAIAVALSVIVRRGAVGTAIDVLARLRLISAERAGRWKARVAAIDAEIKQIGRREVRRGFACAIASRALFITGTVVLMFAAGIPVTAPLVIAMASVGILVTWISSVVPLGLGVADGTNYALYGALGATGAVGLVFTAVNRARTVVLALLGLTVMAIASATARARS